MDIFRCSREDFSNSRRSAAPTASGLTDTEVMPTRTSYSADAGLVEGACPHSDDVIPSSQAVVMILPQINGTQSFDLLLIAGGLPCG
jgi:hypothetical protein